MPSTIPPQPVQAVLFDFDGTLADSFDAITESVNRVADAYGLPHFSDAQVRGKVGYGLPHLLTDLFPNHPVEESVSLYREDHGTIARERTRLLPGVWDVLSQLDRLNVGMAVCSNKAVSFTRELCDALEVARYFAAVLGPEDVAEPKPAPDMLLEAMRRLGVEASRTLYVGDMSIDVETARAAGVPVWVIATGAQNEDDLRAADPDRIMSRFEEILETVR